MRDDPANTNTIPRPSLIARKEVPLMPLFLPKNLAALANVAARDPSRYAANALHVLDPGDGSYRDYVRFYLPKTATVAGFNYSIDVGAGSGGLDNVAVAHDPVDGDFHAPSNVRDAARVPMFTVGKVRVLRMPRQF